MPVVNVRASTPPTPMRLIALLAIVTPVTALAQPPWPLTVRVAAGASVCHAVDGVELCRTREPVPVDPPRSQVRWTLRVDGATWTRVMPDVLSDDVPEETWRIARHDDDGDGTAEAVVARTPVWEASVKHLAPTDVWRWQPAWPDAMRYQTMLFSSRDNVVDGHLVVSEWQVSADTAARPVLVSRRYRVRPGALDPTGEVRARPFTDYDERLMRYGAARWNWGQWMERMPRTATDPLLGAVEAVRTTPLRLDTTSVDPAIELGDLALGTRTPLPDDAYNGRSGDVLWMYLTDLGSAQDVGYVGRVGQRRADGHVDYWPVGYRAADVSAWLIGRRAQLVETAWRDTAAAEALDAAPTALLHLDSAER